MIFDARVCSLGEGPLWHPLRKELFWFDINADTMYSADQSWTPGCTMSAAGWVDEDTLLVASDHGLHRFDIPSGQLQAPLVALEADNPVTRSNDGRADPWGGFWIGTMGRQAERGAGAIYRYWRGTLSVVAPDITIPNSICFTPDRRFAHYTDTPTRKVMRVALDPETGAPQGAAELWLDLPSTGPAPDGAIIDAQGTMWLAYWGTGAVVCFDPEGREIARHPVPGRHPTCPAFGGPELRDLYVTSATERLETPSEGDGQTFVLKGVGQGQAEHQVIL